MPLDIVFGEWLPDLPKYRNPGLVEAKNVVSHVGSYQSFPNMSVFSTALTARCQGSIAEQDDDGNVHVYAGDATKLYRFVDTTATDASVAGGYTVASDDMWEFVKFRNKVYATQIGNVIQNIEMGATAFSNLVTSTLVPRARHFDFVRDFMVIGNTEESGTRFPARVRWSALDDPTDFDEDVATQSDFQDLEGAGGWVQKVVGGEYGVIVQERAITRMTYAGTPLIFQFDKVIDGIGAWAANSVVKFGRFIFFIADESIRMFDGSETHNIGNNKVDRTFFADVDASLKHRIVGAHDPQRKLIAWIYPTSNSVADNPDKILLYDYGDNRFTYADLDTEFIFRGLSQGYTMETLDNVNTNLDLITPSLDSRQWTGGDVLLSGFDTSHRWNNFTGSALDATLETGEMQVFPGHRAYVSEVRSLVDGAGATTTIQVATRNRQIDTESFGSASSLNSDGIHPVEADGRYHRFRMNITGSFTDAIGLEAEATPSGQI